MFFSVLLILWLCKRATVTSGNVWAWSIEMFGGRELSLTSVFSDAINTNKKTLRTEHIAVSMVTSIKRCILWINKCSWDWQGIFMNPCAKVVYISVISSNVNYSKSYVMSYLVSQLWYRIHESFILNFHLNRCSCCNVCSPYLQINFMCGWEGMGCMWKRTRDGFDLHNCCDYHSSLCKSVDLIEPFLSCC